MSKTRPAPGWLWLLLAIVPAASQASEDTATVVLVGLASSAGQTTAVSPEVVYQAAETGLTRTLLGEVHRTSETVDPRLLDDLRHFPVQLREALPAVTSPYLLAVRPHQPTAETWLVELAMVDRERGALLGYQSASLPVTGATERLAEVAAELARQTLPDNCLTPREAGARTAVQQTSPTEPAPAREAVAKEAVAIVASGEVRRTVATAAAAPQPHFAMLPGGARPAPVPSRTTAPNPAEVRELMASFAGQVMGLGGLGNRAGQVRVLEQETELLLIPVGTSPQRDEAVRLWLRVYGVGELTQLEVVTSRPLPFSDRGQAGTWASLDVAGYVPAENTLIDVNRSGLLELLVKGLDNGSTRLGLHLTGAGEATASIPASGPAVVVDIAKSAERKRLWETDGPVPFGGQFRVASAAQGQASWYGGRLHGGPTASGERYNQWAWTAAHRTLPMGTWVRVTNLRNGRAVFLRINDRGPYTRGRILDVSVAAARALGFYNAGVTNVRVEAIQAAS